ncbi:hypothetical protein [Nocardia xishanensis]|uniref:hypothetical protein n=1 Tax=Nocardia xishanensis TaxID=238964 RepID=UPI0008373876|nr:hypothetical protein [Nocardia xishanensis]
MIRTTYSEARAQRRATAKALRARVRRLLAQAVVRFLNGADITAAITRGALVTITAHMRTLGADEELVRRFGSHAGKKVKAAHIALTGVDPQRVWTVRNDRPIEVFAYSPTDSSLTEGLRAYPRTAHLVAA